MRNRQNRNKIRRHAGRKRKFYTNNPLWKEDARQHRETVPQCECGCGGETQASDHIIRWRRGGMVWDKRNRQGLTNACHSTKTRKETNGYMYDFQIGPKGLWPRRPLTWIKEPGWLIGYIRKHGLEAIHSGELFRRIERGEMDDLTDRIR